MCTDQLFAQCPLLLFPSSPSLPFPSPPPPLPLPLSQIAYGDHNMAVHRSGFLKDKLGEVLPAHMTSSRRRVEFERRVLTKHAEISELNMEESKVGRNR